MVRYEISSQDGGTNSRFGSIIFFFTIKVPSETSPLPTSSTNRIEMCDTGPMRVYYLAYVQSFMVEKDGRLLLKSGEGRKVVIDVASIRELIGLVRNGANNFLIRKETSLF
jgi:hypothetical protein